MSRSLVMPTSSTIDHRGGVEGLAAVVEAPQQRRDRAALDAGLPAQGPGRLPRRRRPDHPVPGGLEGVADTGQRGRLARTRHPDHELHPPARGGDGPHRVGLAVGERPAQLGFLTGDDRLRGARRDGGGAGASTPLRNVDGDRGLNGDDRRRGVDPLPGAGHPDERDDLGVPQQHVDRPDQLRGSRPKILGPTATTTSRRANTLRVARRPSGANTSSRKPFSSSRDRAGSNSGTEPGPSRPPESTSRTRASGVSPIPASSACQRRHQVRDRREPLRRCGWCGRRPGGPGRSRHHARRPPRSPRRPAWRTPPPPRRGIPAMRH